MLPPRRTLCNQQFSSTSPSRSASYNSWRMRLMKSSTTASRHPDYMAQIPKANENSARPFTESSLVCNWGSACCEVVLLELLTGPPTLMCLFCGSSWTTCGAPASRQDAAQLSFLTVGAAYSSKTSIAGTSCILPGQVGQVSRCHEMPLLRGFVDTGRFPPWCFRRPIMHTFLFCHLFLRFRGFREIGGMQFQVGFSSIPEIP